MPRIYSNKFIDLLFGCVFGRDNRIKFSCYRIISGIEVLIECPGGGLEDIILNGAFGDTIKAKVAASYGYDTSTASGLADLIQQLRQWNYRQLMQFFWFD